MFEQINKSTNVDSELLILVTRHAFDRQTDGQRDREATAIPVARYKNTTGYMILDMRS